MWPGQKGGRHCLLRAGSLFALLCFFRASLPENSSAQEAVSQNRHASVQKSPPATSADPRLSRKEAVWQPDIDKLPTRFSEDSQSSHFPHFYDSIRNTEMYKSWLSYCSVKETKYKMQTHFLKS